MTKLAQPYLRTSTDDKGQDPARQMTAIGAWAKSTEHLLLEPVVDEGTSGALTPFERPAFMLALNRAKAAGACLVVETPDRFTREGSEVCSWVKMELKFRHGTELRFADEIASNLTADRMLRSARADAAAEWRDGHIKKIKSGIERKYTSKGLKFGGAPPKPLTPAEVELALTLYRPPGKGRFGWRKVAVAINEARGALKVGDVKERRRKSVSHNHVKRVVEPMLLDKKKNGQKLGTGADA